MNSSEVLVTSSHDIPLLHRNKLVIYHHTFKALIHDLFKRGNKETDTNYITIVVIDQQTNTKEPNELDSLSYEDKHLLLKYYFSHLNLIVIEKDQLSGSIDSIDKSIKAVCGLVGDRISRVQLWTGTANNYNSNVPINDQIVATMSVLLATTTTKTKLTTNKIIDLKTTIVSEIDFKSLLSNNTISHLSKLCNVVGHWSFPAHELTNDDLVYCVYLMVKYCQDQLPSAYNNIKLPDNDLMALIFMVRDTYKNGNPFHNFRHAVDVLQACFHYVIRLGYLPIFTQFQGNPRENELNCLYKEKMGNVVELISTGVSEKPSNIGTILNPLSTLSLLLAALGHDVGHPGVTNQFMIKYSSPTSLLFNERSVLESFHSSVFLNKIMVINWPELLPLKIDDSLNLTVKDLIITSILATDMAEHFEYIEKLNHFASGPNTNASAWDISQIKLLTSLLIKCADISNVTRPLRVSAQWALVLSREFDEVSKLEEKIMGEDKQFDIKYDKVPVQLEDILRVNQELPKGQVFFINTFAENLFDNIKNLLPELGYTGEIVKENKSFWQARC